MLTTRPRGVPNATWSYDLFTQNFTHRLCASAWCLHLGVMEGEDSQICAVCLDSTELVLMPCCGRETSTTRFCQLCIGTICSLAPGGFGQCPKCRKTITIEDGKISLATRKGKCRMCCQGNKVIVQQGLCEACLYGSQFTLAYECDRCHRTQRIPHPMWRYQPAPDAYGGATWACHRGCGDYTHWRVIPADLPRVPLQDRPESWGTEAWMDEVRATVRRQRSPGAPSLPEAPSHALEPPQSDEQRPRCVIS